MAERADQRRERKGTVPVAEQASGGGAEQATTRVAAEQALEAEPCRKGWSRRPRRGPSRQIRPRAEEGPGPRKRDPPIDGGRRVYIGENADQAGQLGCRLSTPPSRRRWTMKRLSSKARVRDEDADRA
ncbi:hypothetical protein Dimus_025362 [Dionaea muscipula]